jgi:APA family basic amino acid/polyamine antiporter
MDDADQSTGKPNSGPGLKRALTLPLLTLYGLGATIGAGIYVLIGVTAGKAGIYAPVSFLIAGGVVAFTGLSYCELATRYPVSAGEAEYVRQGFNSERLSLLVGLMVAVSGVVSSAAISIGAAAYVSSFIPLDPELLTILIILVLGVAATWGIVQSITVAAIFTVIEIGGLGLVVWFAVADNPGIASDLPSLVPPADMAVWAGIGSASLLAFFAFVGFEDMANVAEEVRNPARTLPLGIILTLVIAVVIYLAVVSVVVLSVPMDVLVTSDAPLALIFERRGESMDLAFDIIASIATVNGVLIQMIMASRVLYGMAARGRLPRALARVNPVTSTPVVATALVVAIILVLAVFLPIGGLAETTSRIVLVVFVFINIALIRLKLSRNPPGTGVYEVGLWIPVLGCLSSVFLFAAGFF